MIAQTFSTQRLPLLEQPSVVPLVQPRFRGSIVPPAQDGFPATNWNWSVEGLTVSRVRSPPTSVGRSKTNIRRSPVDHWAIILSKHSAADVQVGDQSLEAPAGTPFVLSLARRYASTAASTTIA